MTDGSSAMTGREAQMETRETEVGRREAALAAAEKVHDNRELLIRQVREANEKLVIASLHADDLADEANAASASATENEERFRALITTASVIVWGADALGRFIVDPAAWHAFTGLDIGREPGWLRAIHPDDRGRLAEAWAAAVTGGGPFMCQHRLLRTDGTYAWVISRAAPIVRSEVVREWVGMMSDISDRVRVDEEREQFIGILGHDLRNPLGTILAGAELLNHLPEREARVVERITHSAHRMEALICDVLDMTRGRLGGGIPVRFASCDVGRACADVVDEMRQQHPERWIMSRIAGDLDADCDRARIEQVLSNLLGNAVAHGEGEILLTADGTGDEIVVSVHDEGGPIPATEMGRLFEPFSQGSRAPPAWGWASTSSARSCARTAAGYGCRRSPAKGRRSRCGGRATAPFSRRSRR